MVTIVDYKAFQKENGEEFYSLVVQGGIEAIKSKESGRTYLTARTTTMACTFNEITCKSLVGSQLPGMIQKVEVEPYDYTDRKTGEIIELTHRYEYLSDEDAIINDNVIKQEEVY
ncbi:hypothetical protein IWX84_001862 [Flavobacterium sp. CG_9.10]|uniref:hypothetical protein n=1 Tax=Flavobacterium sp. CG_9.10 TaxID=2787729 RepID=UPI0018CB3FE6|nr:hypothetical protein [Flavobacterium sp. CG_9.10]MBG6110980.1 hypothetical protein [Flavobacterium sp. CG_9.10]